MLPVEIVPVDGTTLVLRARGSELLILPHHIGELKSCKTPKDFTGYFLSNALLNRPARKLFEAWLRKDKSLWQRIYRTIHSEMDANKIKEVEQRMNAMREDNSDKSAEAKAEKKKAPVKEKEEAPKKKAEAKPAKEKTEKAATTPKKKSAASVEKAKPATAKKAAADKKPAKAKSEKAAPAAKKKTTTSAAKAKKGK